MQKATRLTSFAAVFAAALWAFAPIAHADSDVLPTDPVASPAVSPVVWVALALAVLSILIAIVVFLGARKAAQQNHAEIAAMTRRITELKGELSHRGDNGAADAQARLTRVEQVLDEVDYAVQKLEHAQRTAPAQPAPQIMVPTQPTYARSAPAAAAAFAPPPARRQAAEPDALTQFNRALDGSAVPDRAMQKVFSQNQLAHMELLHYVRPSLKMQDAGYAQFCAYERINPSNVALVKLGQHVVPSKLSLNQPAIGDWYDISRQTDKENAAPHMVISTLAIAEESGETVVNESHESKKLIRVQKKGKLVAYNM